ncbi:MAG TPA: LCP family protein [Limnochordales bacterium]
MSLSWRTPVVQESAQQRLQAAAGPDGRLVVVVVGTDRRAHDPGRTDTILVVSLDVENGRVGVLSIPRDTRVRVPGRGYNKINMVFPAGGPGALMETVSALLGVPVEGYVRVDFQAFIGLVDALGGVDVTVERPMRYVDRAQGLDIRLPAGRQHLNGEQALDFVRFRADGLGDVSYDPGRDVYVGRVERQHQFLRALADAALRPSTLLALPRIVRELYGRVETDLRLDLALAAAAWLAEKGNVPLKTGVLPGWPGQVNGVSYWLPDAGRARRVVEEVLGTQRTPVVVAVLNANGVGGSAARVAQELAEEGVVVSEVGNASTFSQEHTWVWATRREHLGAALQVAGLLGVGSDRVRVAPESGGDGSGEPGHQGAEVVVWVGKDLAGVIR